MRLLTSKMGETLYDMKVTCCICNTVFDIFDETSHLDINHGLIYRVRPDEASGFYYKQRVLR